MGAKIDTFRDRVYRSYVTDKMAFSRRYDEDAYRRWSTNTYRQIAGWLPADRSAQCLDVGCGHGNVLHMLARRGYRNLQGIDRSEEQVVLAQRICDHVHQGDAVDYLAEHRDAFDLIVAFDVIEHFTRAESLLFLDRSFQALRSGGLLILQTPNADSPWCSSERYRDLTHETAFGPDSLRNAMRLAGFEHCEFRETGPVVHGIASAARWVMWRLVRLGLQVWNLAETGTTGSGVFTRVFRARGIRP